MVIPCEVQGQLHNGINTIKTNALFCSGVNIIVEAPTILQLEENYL